MKKFQNNDTISIKNFEDFFLVVFVLIDDTYNEFVPKTVAMRRNILDAKLSDSEIITISICGELIGIDSEKSRHSFVKRNYKHLFPKIGCRTRFNRTRRNLLQVTELIREKFMDIFFVQNETCYIIDSFPLPVCQFGRALFCDSFKEYGADYGYCPSKKMHYFGYKVHALITLDGYITSFTVTPASVDDREGLRDLIAGHSGHTILADKGYIGDVLYDEMKSNGIILLALKRKNSKSQWPKDLRRTVFHHRRMVETSFSQLSEQLNAERVRAKSFQGLLTRLVCKVLAHNICMIINNMLGRSMELSHIKQLVL